MRQLALLMVLLAVGVGGIIGWGPQQLNGPCPISHPRRDEKHFCVSVGKQRAVVSLVGDQLAGIACARIPWRRRAAAKVGVFVVGGAADRGDAPSLRASVVDANATVGRVCWELDGLSTYYVVYWLPFAWSYEGGTGSYHSHYLADAAAPLLDTAMEDNAVFDRFEAFSDFDERSPVEYEASTAEIAALPLADGYATWVAVVENTTLQTLRGPALPVEFALAPPNATAKVVVEAGRVRMLHVTVYNAGAPVDIEVEVVAPLSLKRSRHHHRPMRQLSQQEEGAMVKVSSISTATRAGTGEAVQLLVCVSARAGAAGWAGAVDLKVVTPRGGRRPTMLHLDVTVAPSTEASRRAVWGLERMAWLNSQRGLEEEVTAPYTALQVDRGVDSVIIGCLGRRFTISTETGLPLSIIANNRELLAKPITFSLQGAGGSFRLVKVSSTRISWSVVKREHGQRVETRCEIWFDGRLDCSFTLARRSKASFVSLKVPLKKAKYAIGGGKGEDGGLLRNDLDWDWTEMAGSTTRPGVPSSGGKKAGWRVWLGDVDAGIFIRLKGPEREWDSPQGSTVLPDWAASSGASGWRLSEDLVLEAFNDRFEGSHGVFNMSMMATPVKGDWLSTRRAKWEHFVLDRHYHAPYGAWDPPETADIADLGAKSVILHQSNSLNPYINWPFDPAVSDRLEAYVKKSEASVKLYYTLGQLSNHAVEFSAMKQLQSEIFVYSNETSTLGARQTLEVDGANEWLWTHAGKGDYRPGWFTMNPGGEQDASVLNDATGRFLNFYLEGQYYLYRLGIAGLYYDGFEGPPSVQRRVRRFASSKRRFDVHGRAFQYTELLPYVDSMWSAERVDFTQTPDYWLITLSALPFGVFGEMLGSDTRSPVPGSDCGAQCANKWRGMLFAMSNRCGWSGRDPNDNKSLWKLWDAFKIHEARMIGWWDDASVIATSHENILATAYVRKGVGTLIALASWSANDEEITLKINWTALGLDSAIMELPPSSFNPDGPKVLRPNNTILVRAYKGALILLRSPDQMSMVIDGDSFNYNF